MVGISERATLIAGSGSGISLAVPFLAAYSESTCDLVADGLFFLAAFFRQGVSSRLPPCGCVLFQPPLSVLNGMTEPAIYAIINKNQKLNEHHKIQQNVRRTDTMDQREEKQVQSKGEGEGMQTPHKRRVRYKGTHPRSYQEKYKELNPEKYKDTVERVIQKGGRGGHAYFYLCE